MPWVIVAPWIPVTGVRQASAAALVAVAFGSFFVIRGDESDFTVLGPARVVIALLAGLIGIAGFTVAAIDSWLRRRLPRAESSSRPVLAVYWLLLVVGVLLAPFIIAAYFVGDASTFRRPVEVGLVLLVLESQRSHGGRSGSATAGSSRHGRSPRWGVGRW